MLWDGDEDGGEDTANEYGTEHCLKEDGILDGAQSRLLNPNLAVKDLADNVALLILDDPRLRLVAIVRSKRVEGSLAVVILLVHEELPGTNVTMVHTVEDNTHALVGCDQGGNAQNPSNGSQCSPSAARTAESNQDGDDKGDSNETNTESPGEEDASGVTVADGPTNEVGVSLLAERVLNYFNGQAAGRRVGSVREGVKSGVTFLGREVELSRCTLHNVRGDNTVNLFTEWLDGD